MLCPECEQGEVTKVQVRATQEILYVCQECESLWLTAEVMATEPFNCFTSYMEELGLPPLWSSLYVLEPEKITGRQARKYLRSIGSIQVDRSQTAIAHPPHSQALGQKANGRTKAKKMGGNDELPTLDGTG